MRRTALVLLTWALGTGGSVLIGSLGVRLVTSAVTPPRVSPLTHPEVAAALASDAASAREAGGTASPAPSAVQEPRPSGAAGAQPAHDGGGLDHRGASGSPTTPPAPVASTVRTIQSRGGMVAVRYEDGAATLFWARPNAGFQVRIRADGPELVEVEFWSGRHVSVIRAWWGAGAPAEVVREFGSAERDGPGGR